MNVFGWLERKGFRGVISVEACLEGIKETMGGEELEPWL